MSCYDLCNCSISDSSDERVDVSPEDNIAEVGSDLELFCRPENPSLSVWWSATRPTGETLEIVNGKRKVPVSSRSQNMRERLRIKVQ